ncbi:MAG: hypothetical protein ACI8PT_003968 [Gammaproteobacteria bacterium]|jgi:hypothetical protein
MSLTKTQGKPTHPLHNDSPPASMAALMAQAKHIAALDADLAKWLDAPLKAHCRVANADARRVVLEVDSPVWAQRVRFMLPNFVERFARPVSIRIRPVRTLPKRAPLRGANASAQGAIAIESLALSLEQGELRDALERLASRVRTGPTGSTRKG